MKLLKGDEILVTGGKDKGQRGKVEKVFPQKDKVLVLGVNLYKKHTKSMGNQKGGIIENARPLSVGKVALICPKCNKQTRVNYTIDKKGDKSRVCAKCNATLSK